MKSIYNCTRVITLSAFYLDADRCITDKDVPKALLNHVRYRSPNTAFSPLVFPCSCVIKNLSLGET